MSEKSPIIKSNNITSSQKNDDTQPFLQRKVPSILSETENKIQSTNRQSKNDREPEAPKPKTRRFLKLLLIFIVLIIAVFGAFIFVRANNLLNKIYVGQDNGLYNKISGLISSNKLIGEKEGQINILLLGIGGPGHDGPYLSDTIIVAQLRPEEKRAVLTSIPRDYLTNTKEFGQRKINAIFAEQYSISKDYNSAGEKIIETVEKMSGLEIPYFAVVDFEGFKKSVDLLGGIDVEVKSTFTDYTFPNDKSGYLPPVTFKEGLETMDGRRALIYARSRHASGSEGSDFARGIRQQQIIQAVKQKAASLNLITDVKKINELFSIAGDHFHTNLTTAELYHLYNLGKDLTPEQILSLSLDPTTELVCPQTLPESGAFVITLCKDKTNQDLQDFFSQSLSRSAVSNEQPTVWLADTSLTQKNYNKVKAELEANKMTVYKLVYTGKKINQNLIYSVNTKSNSLDFIKQKFDATEVSLPPSGVKIDPTKVDLILILGDEQTTQ